MTRDISRNWVKIKLLVEQYGIPLREAKYLATLPDYKEAAGEWQRENDPAQIRGQSRELPPKKKLLPYQKRWAELDAIQYIEEEE